MSAEEHLLPPLPPTSPPSAGQQRNSSSEPGLCPDSELAKIPPPEPCPTEMDIDMEIPLPADTASRYSPSQVLGGEEEEEIQSPSQSDRKKSVLGKLQAKKRLLAFSAAKAGVAAVPSPTSNLFNFHPPLKKPSPLKPGSIKPKTEPVLAIHSIKEEETQLKKMLAMNSLLADKLNQVKMIASTVPSFSSTHLSPPVPKIEVQTSKTAKPSSVPDKIVKMTEKGIETSGKDKSPLAPAREGKASKDYPLTCSSGRKLCPGSHMVLIPCTNRRKNMSVPRKRKKNEGSGRILIVQLMKNKSLKVENRRLKGRTKDVQVGNDSVSKLRNHHLLPNHLLRLGVPRSSTSPTYIPRTRRARVPFLS